MQLAEKCRYAVDVFAGRLQDKQIHYGLIFALPESHANADCFGVCKCSDLNTRSRHGTIEDWYLGRPLDGLPSGQVVLLIPRTWLIRQGYLPSTVLFLPYRSFAIRRTDEFRKHFWLEWPDGGRIDKSNAVLKAA